MDGEGRGSHPRAGGKGEEQLEDGKEQIGDSPVSLPCLRYSDLKQCGIAHLPKDFAIYKCLLVLNCGT